MNEDVKPGYKTSEFYLTLLQQLLAVAVTFGLPEMDAGNIGDLGGEVIVSSFTWIAAAYALYSYAKSRAEVNAAAKA